MSFRISPAWWPVLAAGSPVLGPWLLVRNQRFRRNCNRAAASNRRSNSHTPKGQWRLILLSSCPIHHAKSSPNAHRPLSSIFMRPKACACSSAHGSAATVIAVRRTVRRVVRLATPA